jgi:hypothetical protein
MDYPREIFRGTRSRQAFTLVLMSGIDEHQTRDPFWMLARKETDIPPAYGRSNENDGTVYATHVEQRSEFFHNLFACPGIWTPFAITDACTIVRADARELADVRLDQCPIEGSPAQARVEDHRRGSGAGTPNLKAMPADIYQLSRRCMCAHVGSGRLKLIDCTDTGRDDQQNGKEPNDSASPAPHAAAFRHQNAKLGFY